MPSTYSLGTADYYDQHASITPIALLGFTSVVLKPDFIVVEVKSAKDLWLWDSGTGRFSGFYAILDVLGASSFLFMVFNILYIIDCEAV